MVFECILAILLVASTFLTYYLKVKSAIEREAIGAINNAENTEKMGEEKMKQAIEQVNKVVPPFLKPIFNDELLEMVIQIAFEEMKEFAEKQVKKKKVGGGSNGT